MWANNWSAANQWHGGRDDKDEESALHSTLSTLNSRIEKIHECHLAMMQNISNLNNNMMEMNRKLGQVYSLALEIGAEQKEMKKKMQLIQEHVECVILDVKGIKTTITSSSSGRPPPAASNDQPPPPRGRSNDAPPTDSKRPRSGSWPLAVCDNSCDWHDPDCVRSLKIDDVSNEVIRDPEYVNGPFWSHLNSVLYDDQGFTKAIMEALEHHMQQHRVELWHAPMTASRNTRRFFVRCRNCQRGWGVNHGPNDRKETGLYSEQKVGILRFLKLPAPEQVV